MKTSAWMLLHGGSASTIPVGKICFVEYFGEEVPCPRNSGNNICTPSYLRPGQYSAPPVNKSLQTHSLFIDSSLDDVDLSDDFRFDYNRGKIVVGSRGEYDLSQGYFTCFGQQED